MVARYRGNEAVVECLEVSKWPVEVRDCDAIEIAPDGPIAPVRRLNNAEIAAYARELAARKARTGK